MKKKITTLIALVCIVCLLLAFVACDNDDDSTPSGQPSGSISSGEVESGQPSGDVGSGDISGSGDIGSGSTSSGDIGSGSNPGGSTGSGDSQYPSGTVIIDSTYQPPQIDDSDYDYSRAFIIEDNTVIGLTEYGKTLSKLVVPSGVTAIGDYAFAQDEDDFWDVKIQSIELPEGVVSIGEGAFMLNLNLVSVNLPNGLRSIGDYAFMLCSSLIELTIPSSLESIGEGQFTHCHSLVVKTEDSEVIPDLQNNLIVPTELETEYKIPVIYNCKNNEVSDDGYIIVVADNGVQYALKDGIAKVKGHAYVSGDITIASNIVYKGEKYQVKEIGLYGFIEMHSITGVEIPDEVSIIGHMAFAGCEGITEINLPDNLKEIGALAFKGCINLQSVKIPSGVTSIGEEAFGDCYALTSIIIPISVVNIDKSVFYSCNNLTIYCQAQEKPNNWHQDWNPSNCTVVWGYDSSNPYPSGTVIITDYQLPQINDSDFDYSRAFIIEDNTVTGLTEYGKTLSKLVVPNGITAIANEAFAIEYDPSTIVLRSVVLPDGLISIGEYAFAGSFNLVSINLPESLTTIGDYAFLCCTSLTELELPKSFSNIEKIFDSCPSLVLKVKGAEVIPDENLTYTTEMGTEYKIPVVYNCKSNEVADDGYVYVIADNGIQYALKDGKAKASGHSYLLGNNVTIASNIVYKDNLYSVNEIADMAFVCCVNVDNFKLPSGITRIGCMAFTSSEITSLELPENLTYIGKGAFNGCNNLQSIEVPYGVETICKYAISSCENLTSIIIPSTVTVMEADAIAECNNLTIYCQAQEKPSGWDDNWNSYGRPVVWGYTAD